MVKLCGTISAQLDAQPVKLYKTIGRKPVNVYAKYSNKKIRDRG